MESRKKAVVMSLGMLLKVDLDALMKTMVAKALEENPAFKFDSVKADVFKLCSQFNRGQLQPNEFARQMLNKLAVTKMKPSGFLAEWNKAVDATGMQESIALIQQRAEKDNLLFYFISDTNESHALKIRDEAKSQGIRIDINATRVSTIAGMPFYPSFKLNAQRDQLLKKACDKIARQSNKPDEIVVLCGDPANYMAGALRDKAELELTRLKRVCADKAEVVLHGKDLAATLDRVVKAEYAKSAGHRMTF